MTADKLVEILTSRGCRPLMQKGLHPVRDAVHETVHQIQSGARTYDRELLHERLCRKAADRSTLVRFELQARAVEMLACHEFGIKYDIEHWAFVMWLETAKSLQVDIGDIEEVRSSIITVSKQRETKALLVQVMALRAKKGTKR
jgi:hypothetical protein